MTARGILDVVGITEAGRPIITSTGCCGHFERQKGTLASARECWYCKYASMWTLSQYIESAPKEKIKSEWDGMEKSIIANFADDVSIGVRNNKLEMTVIKTL